MCTRVRRSTDGPGPRGGPSFLPLRSESEPQKDDAERGDHVEARYPGRPESSRRICAESARPGPQYEIVEPAQDQRQNHEAGLQVKSRRLDQERREPEIE